MNVLVFNIKALSTLKYIIKNNNVIRYYKSPTLDLLKQNKIKEINILERLLKQPRMVKRKSQIIQLHKKKHFLQKILQVRAKLYKDKVQAQIYTEIFCKGLLLAV